MLSYSQLKDDSSMDAAKSTSALLLEHSNLETAATMLQDMISDGTAAMDKSTDNLGLVPGGLDWPLKPGRRRER